MMKERLPSYGGQAVIEGVMMRGSQSVAMAMRAPDGKIVLHSEDLKGIYKSGIGKIPFLRGLIMLWDALVLGIRFLTISANTQTGEDEKIEGPTLYISLGISLVVGVGLFFLLPAGIGQLAEKLLGWNAWVGNVLEGLIRLALLVGYIAAIGMMKDIQKVFGYHGAEHKTINAFEAGAELTPENVARYSVEHPRCGTAFLLTVVVLSIFLFSLLGPLPAVTRLLSRVVLLPVLAGLAYEYIRWTANHLQNPAVRWLIRPSLALQHLTTREPSLEMLEVSITALKTMMGKEKIIP
jgi:uncharacterized protein YqhQ